MAVIFLPLILAFAAIVILGSLMIIGGLYGLIKQVISTIYEDIQEAKAVIEADKKVETPQPLPRGQNVIELDTIAAMAYIKNHEAMQFVKKA